ncbi:uncharacterized protein KY384_007686 [Bacidia gigantensis]|uniref:uncharacterized protein n=1 Tax=Bacidia gigantensis TaxID=2732470 RepID=UPI001D04565E|nr:uncharacterized protein KY384_007686 [Bacidia gigantensis]KAG8527534.1 hypothetical protein KY384_007686 [Bacidia gigantensis]
MPFAQLVIGPPGSGKSTYCDGMHQFLSTIGRKCSVVNLDPANDHTSYESALDIRSLVTLDEVMNDENLGPNGGTLYALEELEHNVEWLEEGLKALGEDYMDLSHLNILTKIDKISSYGPLPFNLDFYTEVQDLSYILPHLAAENPMLRHPKFEGLNNAVVDLVEDFGLVGFETLAVEDKKSMMTLLQAIDRASGYAFGGAEGANDTIWQVAMREGLPGMTVFDVQERWIDRKDEFDEIERQEADKALQVQRMAHPLGGDGGIDFDDGQTPGSGIKVIRRSPK